MSGAMGKKRAVKVDISNWGLGDWPEELQAAILPNIEIVVRKIAQEAIEAFFNTGDPMADIGPEGVTIDNDSLDIQKIFIPWHTGGGSDMLWGVDASLAAVQAVIKLCQNECEIRGIAFPPPTNLTEEEWNAP